MTDAGRPSLPFLLATNEELLFQKFLSAVSGAGLHLDEAKAEQWRTVFRTLVGSIQDWCAEHGMDATFAGANFPQDKKVYQLGASLADKAHDNAIAFPGFFPIFKMIEQSCTALLLERQWSMAEVGQLRGFFDRVEEGICSRWLEVEAGHYQKELRQARYHLLHEKRRYFVVFQRMAEPAFVVDDRLRIIDVNQSCLEFFGGSPKEFMGRACCDLLGHEVCRACALEDALAAQTSFSNIEVSIAVGGQEKTVLMNGTFLGDINHEYPGILVILKDITEKKATELALRDSEEKYRSLVENVPEAVWRADHNGRFLFISPNIERICGYPASEFTATGLAGSSHIHADDAARVRKALRRFFAAEEDAFDVHYRFLTWQGEWIWLHDRAGRPYEKDSVWYADGVVSDITALKRVEAELERHRSRLAELVDARTEELRSANLLLQREVAVRERAEEELTELAKRLQRSNRELEQFAHVASHDLKEPLLLIIAFCAKLIDRCYLSLDTKGRQYVDRIQRSAGKMQALIDDLLQLSRIARSERALVPIDLNTLVQEVVDDLEEQIKKENATVKLSVLHDLEGDRVQVRQLFQNIIANALKFRKENRPPVVQVHSRLTDDGMCEIMVEDNGIGFDEKYLARIFTPFERLHPSSKYEGTGIGLATCSSIAARHGGEITARSVPGKGSVFIVKLPSHQVAKTRKKG